MDLDLNNLLEQAVTGVKRDLAHILTMGMDRKLPATAAKDLVSYVKVLSDILEEQKKVAKNLPKQSEEELRALASELLK